MGVARQSAGDTRKGEWRAVPVGDWRTRPNSTRCFRALLRARHAGAEAVVLVLDRPDTHSPDLPCAAFPAAEARRLAERIGLRHTPRHGSRPSVAEIGLAVLER